MKKAIGIILCCLFGVVISAQENERVVDLRGRWKFSIGDHMEWAQTDYNDKDWESIYAPSSWEDQGYNSYDGFAWYRKNISVPADLSQRNLYLNLGFIDDADEVYFNGHLVGFSGSMPPKYSTAFNALRKYFIPASFIKFDKPNTIAIRVYDSGLAGGIVSGIIGIYSTNSGFPMEIDLQGMWKFKTGDHLEYSNPLLKDDNWRQITVPRIWEDQGYTDYDGFAWYRKKFLVSGINNNERFVIVLGKIDDVEEVYLNGKYIGPLKRIEESEDTRYGELRAYYIAGNLLQNNKYNVLCVRVKDFGGAGGIYEGPVGIVKQKNYVQYWKSKR